MRNRFYAIWDRILDTNRYALSAGLFAIWMCTFAQVDVVRMAQTRMERNRIEERIQHTETAIQHLDEQVAQLKDNPLSKEQHARESYFMHKPNEDVYIFR